MNEAGNINLEYLSMAWVFWKMRSPIWPFRSPFFPEELDPLFSARWATILSCLSSSVRIWLLGYPARLLASDSLQLPSSIMVLE